MQGFLLGLSIGTVCLAYCAPVLVPYLLGEGKSVMRNVSLLAQFLLGRLAGYLLFGVLAWMAGSFVVKATGPREIVFGLLYMALAILLLVYGFGKVKTHCAAESSDTLVRRLSSRWPALLPLIFGLLTGLNLCPPFLLAITGAAETGSLWGSIWFFLMFFLGTALYFIPIPFLGTLRRMSALQTVGKFAAGLIGLYYFYTGAIMFYGGVMLL